MSYDADLTTDLDKARALLGDTSSDELLTDDHIEAVIGIYTFSGGIAFLADELAARYAQKPDRVTLPSGLSVTWSARVATWQALASQMRSVGVGAAIAFSVTPTRSDGYAEMAAAG